MSRLQVLVTSMHQTDLSLAETMNLDSDVLIANQAGTYDYCKTERNGSTIEMVTTATIGTSRNRNIAIGCSSPSAEYLMFADDDLVLCDQYEDTILGEFAEHPEADAIIFNVENTGSRPVVCRKTFTKGNMCSLAAGGVCCLVIKRAVLLEKNLRFNESFGPGTEKYCGEDTIFLQSLLKKRVRVYHSPKFVANICHEQDGSSWFEGYNERYFIVGGMVLANVYPFLSWLIVVRSAYRFSQREYCKLPFAKILKCYWAGIKEERRRR